MTGLAAASTGRRQSEGVLLADLVQRLRSAERTVGQLEGALASNRRIGMAVGVLMCRYGLTDEQGFEFLSRLSQERNVKVRELAEGVIGTAASGTAPPTRAGVPGTWRRSVAEAPGPRRR